MATLTPKSESNPGKASGKAAQPLPDDTAPGDSKPGLRATFAALIFGEASKETGAEAEVAAEAGEAGVEIAARSRPKVETPSSAMLLATASADLPTDQPVAPGQIIKAVLVDGLTPKPVMEPEAASTAPISGAAVADTTPQTASVSVAPPSPEAAAIAVSSSPMAVAAQGSAVKPAEPKDATRPSPDLPQRATPAPNAAPIAAPIVAPKAPAGPPLAEAAASPVLQPASAASVEEPPSAPPPERAGLVKRDTLVAPAPAPIIASAAPTVNAPAVAAVASEAFVSSLDAMDRFEFARLSGDGPLQTAIRVESAAPATSTANTPAANLALAKAVASQIGAAAARIDGSRIELRLEPPELGRVNLSFTITEDGMTAVLAADKPETIDLMRRHADQLAKELAEAGYEDVDLSFADDPSQAEDQPDKAQAGASVETLDAGGEASGASGPVSGAGAGLDIRI